MTASLFSAFAAHGDVPIILKIALIDPTDRPIRRTYSKGRAGLAAGVSGFNHRPQPPGNQARRVRPTFYLPNLIQYGSAHRRQYR